jgi:hypothetical protein
MNIVLIQELVRFNELIKVIKDSIKQVKKAIKGEQVMSSALEEVFNSMLVGKIPNMWANKSYPSLKSLGNYLRDLYERIHFFNVTYFHFIFYLQKCILTKTLVILGMDCKWSTKCLLAFRFLFCSIFPNRNYAKLCAKT